MKCMACSTRLIDRIPRVEGVKTYRFERIRQYEFEPGQWFVLTIPDGDDYHTKHFTHSSAPTEGYIDLTTRLTGSTYKNALDALTIGTEVEIEGPYGEFVLREGATKIAFLTGGIGITPVRSILRSLADSETDIEIALLYGNKDQDSIPFRQELQDFGLRLPRLRVAHVLTDPLPGWDGYLGYIDEEIIETELGSIAGWTFYVSGPPAMVSSLEGLLRDRGVPPDAVVLESFTGY